MKLLFLTWPRRIFSTAACLLLLLGAYCGALQLTGNVHTVIAGELYRSAQPSGTMLSQLITEYGIKTVINLRGENLAKDWYQDEVAVTQRLGVAHVDFRMSNKIVLSEDRAREIIDIMAKAEKPILIHCKAGADRTGLVSALYMAAIAKADEGATDGQLSVYYGHVALPFTKTWAMDETLKLLKPMLGFPPS
jgi:protein tyrosine/serine phosphatase